MAKRRGFLASGLAIVFVAIQWLGPVQSNPPVVPSHTMQSQIPVPPPVAAILNRSCMDCHSDETHWPLCGRIAPVSWWLVDNVNSARRAMNLSEWTRYRPAYALATLTAMSEAVKKHAMPPDSYLEFHPQGGISDDERMTLSDWAQSERYRLQDELLNNNKKAKMAKP